MYWAMSTLTTVGYGDVTPQNDAEKMVSMIAMVVGVTVFAYFMGNTASLISAGNATEAAVAQRLAQVRLLPQPCSSLACETPCTLITCCALLADARLP